jgi:hypothetical protein
VEAHWTLAVEGAPGLSASKELGSSNIENIAKSIRIGEYSTPNIPGESVFLRMEGAKQETLTLV